MPYRLQVLQFAAVQMNAAPAPLSERLGRAATLIAEAAQAGANLIALPENFNTGYSYDESLYAQAETLQGPSLAWLKEQAAAHKIYVVGSILLRDVDEVYNAAFLVAPDGRYWRYDKQYPYLWERSFYREGRRLCIAETEFGRIGLMIGWDAAHAELWARYAGRVDMMIVLSTAPALPSAALVSPSGASVPVLELGAAYNWMARNFASYLSADLQNQARWLGVPVLVSSGVGEFDSPLPMPALSVAALVALRRDLWPWLDEAGDVRLRARFEQVTQIVSEFGVLQDLVSGSEEGFVIAKFATPLRTLLPRGERTALQVPAVAYPLVDGLGPALMAPVYRRGLRRQWGARMGPQDTQTRLWLRLLAAVLLLGLWLGSRRRR